MGSTGGLTFLTFLGKKSDPSVVGVNGGGPRGTQGGPGGQIQISLNQKISPTKVVSYIARVTKIHS